MRTTYTTSDIAKLGVKPSTIKEYFRMANRLGIKHKNRGVGRGNTIFLSAKDVVRFLLIKEFSKFGIKRSVINKTNDNKIIEEIKLNDSVTLHLNKTKLWEMLNK
jgi:hypothetical protein